MCWDNAWADSFNATLKNEGACRMVHRSNKKAIDGIASWIELRHNHVRLHSALGTAQGVLFLADELKKVSPLHPARENAIGALLGNSGQEIFLMHNDRDTNPAIGMPRRDLYPNITIGGSSQLGVWWCRWSGRGGGLLMMEVPTPPAQRTSTCMTLPSVLLA